MKLRLGRISYANTRPVHYDLDRGMWPLWIECVKAAPSKLNHMLAEGLLDVSSVSSVAYARHFRDWLILPEISISSKGEIMSVLLVSKIPIERLNGRKIATTHDSETAVDLLKLCLEREQITPIYQPLKAEHAGLPNDADAALVIGDEALRWSWEKRTPFVMDLGLYWEQWTKKPLVFALWAVRGPFAEERPNETHDLISLLHDSLGHGTSSLEDIILQTASDMGIGTDHMRRYFQRLTYKLQGEEREGLSHFFELLYKRGILHEPVDLNFFDS
ncbi:MAG: menaquinone biosynthesis protein [Thermodesulfobacteriota bacterium]|nr:menaquinone biosynthesis protein [Thermodesulfobacteriota bacterium]